MGFEPEGMSEAQMQELAETFGLKLENTRIHHYPTVGLNRQQYLEFEKICQKITLLLRQKRFVVIFAP